MFLLKYEDQIIIINIIRGLYTYRLINRSVFDYNLTKLLFVLYILTLLLKNKFILYQYLYHCIYQYYHSVLKVDIAHFKDS